MKQWYAVDFAIRQPVRTWVEAESEEAAVKAVEECDANGLLLDEDWERSYDFSGAGAGPVSGYGADA